MALTAGIMIFLRMEEKRSCVLYFKNSGKNVQRSKVDLVIKPIFMSQ
jgi:hypothetical protein